MIKILSVVVTFVFLTSCAGQQAYEGNKLSTENIAIIRPASQSFFSYDPAIAIVEVDGEKLDRLSSGVFEVLPGTHTVKAILFNVSSIGWTTKSEPKKITFEASAGETYIVGYKWATGHETEWLLYVKEKSTDRIVSQ